MQVLLIGPYPPPIGGISVHIQRMLTQLSEGGHEASVLDYTAPHEGKAAIHENLIQLPAAPLAKVTTLFKIAYRLTKRALVHIHIADLERFIWAGPLLVVLFWRQKKIISLHSGSFIARTNHWRGRLFVRLLLSTFQHIVAVNVEQQTYLLNLGFPANKVSVIPAFIPQKPDDSLTPQALKERSAQKTVVLASGYLTPLYNYDGLITCISQLPTEEYLFVFAFYHETDPAYETHVMARLADLPNVIILRNQPPDVFIALMARCHIYVRPTMADGDAVAIREALSLNKQVFASDVVKRPSGTQLFPPHDADRLLALFLQQRDDPEHTTVGAGESNFDKLLAIYEMIDSGK